MSLQERISTELKLAMKRRDKLRTETLRSIRAQLLEKEISKRGKGGMTEEDELGVLQTAVKRRKESIELFGKGGRMDLVEQETKELEIIYEYLPKQLGIAEIEGIVRKIIERAGAVSVKDFGKIMPLAINELKGKAEGKIIQEIVRKILQEKS